MKRRIITLTHQAPIAILEEDWPIIAHATYIDRKPDTVYDLSMMLKVRRHRDGGQVVVYGRHTLQANALLEMGGKEDILRGGVLLTERSAQNPDAIAEAIHAVAREFEAITGEAHWRMLPAMCIATLPVVQADPC